MTKNKNMLKGMDVGTGANTVLNIVLGLLAIMCIFPLLLVIAISVTDEGSLVENGYSLFPQIFSTEAYRYIFSDFQSILNAYKATLFVTVTGSIISVIIVCLYAYPLSRKDFPYRKLFAFFIYFTMLFNGGLVPWYMVYVRVLDLKNNYWALIMPALVSPWYVMIVRTFFKTTIPDSLIESAKIDGATDFYTFIKIVLPLAKPVIATIMLFSVLYYWNSWYYPMLFITEESKMTLQYLLYKIEQNIQFLLVNASEFSGSTEKLSSLPSESIRMAIAVVAIGPIVLAYPFFQKYFVKGLTVGAIKG